MKQEYIRQHSHQASDTPPPILSGVLKEKYEGGGAVPGAGGGENLISSGVPQRVGY